MHSYLTHYLFFFSYFHYLHADMKANFISAVLFLYNQKCKQVVLPLTGSHRKHLSAICSTSDTEIYLYITEFSLTVGKKKNTFSYFKQNWTITGSGTAYSNFPVQDLPVWVFIQQLPLWYLNPLLIY